LRRVAGWGGSSAATLGAALVAGGVWWLLALLFAPTLSALEERSGDWAWRSSASNARESRVILIDIDEASLQQLGPWPWPRQRMAELSDKLAAEGASLQVLDIIFPSPARGDAQFIASLKKNNAVLAQTFAFDANTQASSGQPATALAWAACPANLPVAQGYIANDPAFAALPVGHITPHIEEDGNLRRQPGLICHQGKVYPALFIAALAQALVVDVAPMQAGLGLLGPMWQLPSPSFERRGLPLDQQGLVRVPWTLQPDAFVSISAADVLAGRVPQRLLQNAWVVVGSSSMGLNDRTATPFGGNSAGFMVHAQLLRGALDGTIPVQPRYMQAWGALVAALSTLLLSALVRLRRKPVFVLVFSGLALAAAMWLVKSWLLISMGLWFEWVLPAVYVLLFALCLGLFEYARDRLERDRIYNHLSSYLPRPVAAALMLQDPSDAIDVKRRTITVLFADIRNFPVYCETHPPEEVAAVLHAFFSMVTRLVERNGGTVESFQGNAVLAVWRHEVGSSSPQQALTAAVELLRESLHTLPKPEPDDMSPLVMGMGLETGLATVGSFGLARRRTHLAIGHPVTMATLLQEMTIELAHPILLGEGIAANLGSQQLVSQGVFLLEGLKTPSHIYAYPLRDSFE
jgi:adenylate cyclase